MKTLIIVLFICGITKSLRIGESCEVNKKNGVCKNIRDCPIALANWRQKEIFPIFCDTITRIVCCEGADRLTTQFAAKRISGKKCEEYSEILSKTVIKQSLIEGDALTGKKDKCSHSAVQLIIGGTTAGEREFPHMCLIGFAASRTDFQYGCAGSLISENFILSAAHCIFNRELKEAKWAKLGDVTRGVNSPNTYVYTIVQRFKHPNYSSRSIDNDIALFKLDKNVEFNEYVIPLCLPQREQDTKQAIATGWGAVGFAEQASSKMLKVTLELFGQTECQSKYPSEGMIRNGVDYLTKLCAGSHTLNKDTCSGDSGYSNALIHSFNKGGPLQIYNLDGVHCMYTIIGVTSFGHVNCGTPGVPGIYTRVHHYLDWIEGIVWG